jgi:hypothetical protein
MFINYSSSSSSSSSNNNDDHHHNHNSSSNNKINMGSSKKKPPFRVVPDDSKPLLRDPVGLSSFLFYLLFGHGPYMWRMPYHRLLR